MQIHLNNEDNQKTKSERIANAGKSGCLLNPVSLLKVGWEVVFFSSHQLSHLYLYTVAFYTICTVLKHGTEKVH